MLIKYIDIMRLKDKIAIVTGGCRGIGLAIVEKLATEGAKVYALDYVLPEADFINDENIKDQVKALQVDVTDYDSVTKAVDHVIAEAGRIDILVNNAGITRDNLVLRLKEEDWDSVIATNLKGTYLCSKAVCRQMMSQRQGRIINIGSVVGTIGNAGQANYSASKAGVIGLTKSLAKEFGSRNILVNCIAPGFVETEMTKKIPEAQIKQYLDNIPLNRPAKPKDVADVVMFFCSNESSYITGQVIHVDGGLAI
jgi:3-oxoacyl-[acyl-carrier protein] reductase